MRLWIKDPLAIFADGAARGLVVDGTRIVELIGRGGEPAAPVAATFDASRHVVLPGLVNAHHHFYQTLTRASSKQDLNRELIPWLTALNKVWARLKPNHFRVAVRLALIELLLSWLRRPRPIIIRCFRSASKTRSISRSRRRGGLASG